MEAVKNGGMDTAQHMADKATKANGLTIISEGMTI